MKNAALPTIVRIIRHEGEAKVYVIDAAEFRNFVLTCGVDVTIDEEDYLARNPDVAEAVAAGGLPSASYHYKYFGYFEGRVAKLIKGDVATGGRAQEKRHP